MASGCSFVWSGVRFVVARPQGHRCLGRVVSSGGVLLGDGLAGGVVEGQWWFWLLIGMFRASHGCVRCDWVADGVYATYHDEEWGMMKNGVFLFTMTSEYS
ncbi:hypothetical protein Dimus_033653 [Dionaea muscipula]